MELDTCASSILFVSAAPWLYFKKAQNCFPLLWRCYTGLRTPNTKPCLLNEDLKSFSLEELKVWMALNFLNLNENKTEVVVSGPGVIGGSFSVDTGR